MQLPFVSRKKYEDLIYKLECLLCYVTGGKLFGANHNLAVMKNAALDHIEGRINDAIGAAAAERWISVKEWLPGTMENVLVRAYCHESWQTLVGWYNVQSEEWWIYTFQPRIQRGLKVSHWMPLPEPPKMKGGEKHEH